MKWMNTKKLNQVKLTKDDYYVVLDFDKTITSKSSLDSWMAVADFEVLGKTCEKEWEQLNAKYEPIELDYTLDSEVKRKLMVEWYEKSMDLLYQHKLTYSKMIKALQKGRLEFREGAKEFLGNLYKDGVPVIILSAGIGNAIEEFLKVHNSYYDNIYIISNFIEFRKGEMQEFHAPIIHSMNKKLENHLPQIWKDKIEQKQYTILCGDIIEDLQMINEESRDIAITIAFLNKKVEENMKFYQQNFDIVLTDQEACFQEVQKIIREEERENEKIW